MFIGTNIVSLDCVSSTNLYVRTNLKDLKDGSFVIAKTQTAGRGRLKRRWESEIGNLYCSFLLKDHSWIQPITRLPILCSVALRRTVVGLTNSDAVMLKWPNDLLYKGAKLSGILIESEQDALVVGVGLNIAKAPIIPDKNTACVKQMLPPQSKIPEPQKVASELIRNFNDLAVFYVNNGFDIIRSEWETYCAHLNKKVAINEGLDDNTSIKEAVFLGLELDGGAKLNFQGAEGIKIVHYGELDGRNL